MHPNPAFRRGHEATHLASFDRIAFTRIFVQTPAGPRVAHAPSLIDGRALRFHLANGNAVAKSLDGAHALALAEGPNGYLSANWYDDVRGAVPTWNYVAIECDGPVRALGRAALVTLLDQLATKLEPRVSEDWTRSKMDPERFERMLGAITCFEMTIESVRATHKLSQNQSDAVADRLIDRMRVQSAPDVAQAMREARA